jgi:hypothetical protein
MCTINTDIHTYHTRISNLEYFFSNFSIFSFDFNFPIFFPKNCKFEISIKENSNLYVQNYIMGISKYIDHQINYKEIGIVYIDYLSNKLNSFNYNNPLSHLFLSKNYFEYLNTYYFTSYNTSMFYHLSIHYSKYRDKRKFKYLYISKEGFSCRVNLHFYTILKFYESIYIIRLLHQSKYFHLKISIYT